MSLPIASLVAEHREIGLVVAVLIGFGFGFVLERAGFGRSTKLAAQFYLYDMTVFKVMFGAIVTAMLGLVGLSGIGVLDLAAVSESAASVTYMWPMLVGGLMLGVGFIVSGYCPGTSLVATASGNIDGLFAISGVAFGSVLFAEAFPLYQAFYVSGDLGQLFLYQWLGLPPAVVAVAVTMVAIGAFIGAEKVEKIMTARIAVARDNVDEEVRGARAPRRFAFGAFASAAAVAVITLFLPAPKGAEASVRELSFIEPARLAEQIFDRPWSLRVIDTRAREACASERIPGAECVPLDNLRDLGLAFSKGSRTLVLVGESDITALPPQALQYRGEVRILRGGHPAWHDYALVTPEPLSAEASTAEREAYALRAAVNSALTGRKAEPPPAAPIKAFVAPKKKKGGGCG